MLFCLWNRKDEVNLIFTFLRDIEKTERKEVEVNLVEKGTYRKGFGRYSHITCVLVTCHYFVLSLVVT